MPAELLPGFGKKHIRMIQLGKIHFVTLVTMKSPMKAFKAHKSTRIVHNCGYCVLCGISVVKCSLPSTVCHRLQWPAELPAEGRERWAPQLRQGGDRQ